MNALHEEIASSFANSSDEHTLSYQKFSPNNVSLGLSNGPK